jgi:dTDP-glucose pyrophosphorylase
VGGRFAGMTDWTRVVVSPETPLREAMAHIDRGGLQLALVVDDAGRLAGVLSDGDVRRAILRGIELSVPTAQVMNVRPTVAAHDTSPADLLRLMRRRTLRHVPLVDVRERVVGLATLESLLGGTERPNWIVLMAGGFGSRLMPLTERCPKPALRVDGKPILEITLEHFHEQGFRHFFIAVHYLADIFKDHFGDGEAWGVNISYLHEELPLGTAGALSLLPGVPDEPVLVVNGDVLSRVRLDDVLAFHARHRAAATMAVREYDVQIPYGVVRVADGAIAALEEKPMQRFLVNAGIYALAPESLAFVPPRTAFDMPALFDRLRGAGHRTVAYPLHEYWLDVGGAEEFERAQAEWRATRSVR